MIQVRFPRCLLNLYEKTKINEKETGAGPSQKIGTVRYEALDPNPAIFPLCHHHPQHRPPAFCGLSSERNARHRLRCRKMPSVAFFALIATKGYFCFVLKTSDVKRNHAKVKSALTCIFGAFQQRQLICNPYNEHDTLVSFVPMYHSKLLCFPVQL